MSSRLIRLALSAGLVLMVLVAPSGRAAGIPPDCDPLTEDCGPVITTDHGQRQLTVSKNTGFVSSTPAGISCGTDCSQTTLVQRDCFDGECEAWPDATSYVLTASGGPPGYSAAWSGATCGVGPTCTVSLGGPDTGDDAATVHVEWRDTQAPSVSFNPPAKVGATGSVSATASDNSGGIATYSWTVDNVLQAWTGSTLSLAAFANGDHTVKVSARDAAGNRSSEVSRTVRVDKVVALSTVPLPAITSATTVPLQFTTDPDVVVSECSFDGGDYADCLTGVWSGVTAATPDGDHTYRVQVTDDVGNVAESALLTTRIDRTAPVIAFTDGPTEGQQVVTSDIAITFSHADANPGTVRCKLDAAAFTVCTPNTAFPLSALANGPHVFTVEATDLAGNVTTINRTFAVVVPTTTPATTPTTPTTPTTTTTEVPFAPQFSHRARSTRRLTTFKKLVVRDLPSTASVNVRCSGGGCAFRSRKLKHSGGTLDVLKKLKRIELRPRATLRITVRAADGSTSAVKYTVRVGKKPKVSHT